MSRKFYISTPIYYVNARPHIGHTYTTLAADVLARWHRMSGDDTFFLTGTDEHGAKIEEKATAAGQSPREFADTVAASFQLAWDELNIANDRFIRTTEEAHIRAVQNALQTMYDKGDIYLGRYEGLYCRGCEQYKAERDLVDGKCPDHQTVPEKMSEEAYMFRLSRYRDELLRRIKADELRILPAERKNEVVAFYEREGLSDISFSRKNVQWGIPLPWDPAHTTYVWADAFLNYLTGLGWDGLTPPHPPLAEERENADANVISTPSFDPAQDRPHPPLAEEREAVGDLRFFPPDVQLMSKDIIRVHSTIWPAMLLSLDLSLPRTMFVHGFFLVDGQKMSKSLGNVVAPEDLVKRYGSEATRYLVLSSAPFGRDGDIGWSRLDERYTADLANGIGNLVARTTTLCSKMQNANLKMQNDKEKLKIIYNGEILDNTQVWREYSDRFEALELDQALNGIIELGKHLDGVITATKPWALLKTDPGSAAVVLYYIAEWLRQLSWMLWPYLPETAEKTLGAIGLDPTVELKQDLAAAQHWGGLPEDTEVRVGGILFPRIEK